MRRTEFLCTSQACSVEVGRAGGREREGQNNGVTGSLELGELRCSVVGHDVAAKVEIMPEDTGGVGVGLGHGGVVGVVDAWVLFLQALAERRGLARDQEAPLREEVRGSSVAIIPPLFSAYLKARKIGLIS